MFLIFVLHLCERKDSDGFVLRNPFDDLREYQIWQCMERCQEKRFEFCKDKLECTLDCLDQQFRKCIPQNILDKCQNECISLQGCPRRNKCVIQCLVEYHKGLLNPDLKYYEEHELDDSFYMIIGSIIMVVSSFMFLVYNCLPDDDEDDSD